MRPNHHTEQKFREVLRPSLETLEEEYRTVKEQARKAFDNLGLKRLEDTTDYSQMPLEELEKLVERNKTFRRKLMCLAKKQLSEMKQNVEELEQKYLKCNHDLGEITKLALRRDF